MDEHRGDTTRLSQELGANLPLLNCRFDARGTPAYVEEWCSHLRAGTDGSFSTQGVRRFIKLGTFEERADLMKARRKVRQAHARATVLSSRLEYRPLSHQNHDSPDSQEPDSPETSRSSAESNASESCEGRASSGENPPTESRFTFTDGRDSKESDESRFTFTGHR